MYLQMICLEDRALLDFESFLSGYNFFSFFILSCLNQYDMTRMPTIWGKLESDPTCKFLTLFYGFIDLFVYKEISKLTKRKKKKREGDV